MRHGRRHVPSSCPGADRDGTGRVPARLRLSPGAVPVSPSPGVPAQTPCPRAVPVPPCCPRVPAPAQTGISSAATAPFPEMPARPAAVPPGQSVRVSPPARVPVSPCCPRVPVLSPCCPRVPATAQTGISGAATAHFQKCPPGPRPRPGLVCVCAPARVPARVPTRVPCPCAVPVSPCCPRVPVLSPCPHIARVAHDHTIDRSKFGA